MTCISKPVASPKTCDAALRAIKQLKDKREIKELSRKISWVKKEQKQYE